jgi:hypothetical protein
LRYLHIGYLDGPLDYTALTSISQNTAQRLIAKVDRKITATLCGSYRRGKPFSGVRQWLPLDGLKSFFVLRGRLSQMEFLAQDLDILITHPKYRSDNDESAEHKKIKPSLLHDVVNAMTRAHFVTDVLAEGESKFMVR